MYNLSKINGLWFKDKNINKHTRTPQTMCRQLNTGETDSEKRHNKATEIKSLDS